MKWAIPLVILAATVNCSFQLSCEISVPEIVLSELVGSCDTNSKSRTLECTSAMHRFCNNATYPPNLAGIKLGVSKEHTNQRIGMSCLQAHWGGDVGIAELQRHHSGCTMQKSQHRDCLSAIHQYCSGRFGSAMAGMSQEIGSGVLRVLCFKSTRKESVPINILRQLHSGCTYSDSDNCFAAASRWCSSFGFSGGITQEVGNSLMTVACYNAEFSNDVFVQRISDFYSAQRRIKICNVNFTIDQGRILKSVPEELSLKVYDNSGSRVPLTSTFEVSKVITETNHFTHEHLVNLGVSAPVSVYLPFYSADINVSAFPTSVDLMRENSKSIPYTHTSSVSVPAGYAIVKKVTITTTTLTVPWTGRVVNGLGAVTAIHGQWNGVSTNNFQILQTDVKKESI